MYFNPITGRTDYLGLGDLFVSGPPEPRAETPYHRSCLDFPPRSDGVQTSVLTETALTEVRRIADICASGRDDRASAQTGFWYRTLDALSGDKAGTLGGTCIEELRWHYLQFSRRNDASWWPLCAGIDEYFGLQEQLAGLLHRYRSPDETDARKVEIRDHYEAVAATARSYLADLHADRLRLSGADVFPRKDVSDRTMSSWDRTVSRP